jgi:hypothetical protein
MITMSSNGMCLTDSGDQSIDWANTASLVIPTALHDYVMAELISLRKKDVALNKCISKHIEKYEPVVYPEGASIAGVIMGAYGDVYWPENVYPHLISTALSKTTTTRLESLILIRMTEVFTMTREASLSNRVLLEKILIRKGE